MFDLFKRALVGATLLTTSQVSATIITHTGGGTAVTNVAHIATFDNLAFGDSLLNYTEGGLSISVDDTHNSFAGQYYGSGGNNSFVTISTGDGSDFFGLELDVFSGSTGFNNVVWQTFKNGIETGFGLLRNVNANFGGPTSQAVTLGWSDIDLFDTIHVGLGRSSRSGVPGEYTNFGQFNFIALDNIKVDLGTTSPPTTAVSEPTALGLFGLGLAFMARVRRKTRI